VSAVARNHEEHPLTTAPADPDDSERKGEPLKYNAVVNHGRREQVAQHLEPWKYAKRDREQNFSGGGNFGRWGCNHESGVGPTVFDEKDGQIARK